jgi:hypothetical protein
VTRHQLELLQPARARPHLLEMTRWPGSSACTATRPPTWACSRTRRTSGKAGPGLTGQRAGVTAYDVLITRLRRVNAEVPAVADELSHGTINTVLAKSRLELGIEALMPGPGRLGTGLND